MALIAQGLGPSTPAKEYLRFGGQTVAIENAIAGAASAGIYNYTDPRIQYSGTWAVPGQSKQTGAAASFNFIGTTVSYVYRLYPSCGVANVYIDGNLAASIDE